MDNLFDMLKGSMLDVIWSFGTFGGYNPVLDPLHAYLENLPQKNKWIAIFNHSHNFPKAFDKFKRALDIIDIIVLAFS